MTADDDAVRTRLMNLSMCLSEDYPDVKELGAKECAKCEEEEIWAYYESGGAKVPRTVMEAREKNVCTGWRWARGDERCGDAMDGE